jgi:hypothetical protein
LKDLGRANYGCGSKEFGSHEVAEVMARAKQKYPNRAMRGIVHLTHRRKILRRPKEKAKPRTDAAILPLLEERHEQTDA